MTYDSSAFTYTLYHDSRGEPGMSGQLLLATSRDDGTRYLVKHIVDKDIGNEYLAHKLALALDVPTTDAILIGPSKHFILPYAVGIEFIDGFKQFNSDDLIGNARADKPDEDTVPILIEDKEIKKPALPEIPKYRDDDPILLDFMRQIAFKYMIQLNNNLQYSIHNGRLISFDYADSFPRISVNQLYYWLSKGDAIVLDIHRKESDALLDTYLDPFFAFDDLEEEYIQSLFDEMSKLGIRTSHYVSYFKMLREAVQHLLS